MPEPCMATTIWTCSTGNCCGCIVAIFHCKNAVSAKSFVGL